MAIPLLTTKLYIPPPRPELVPRPRLIERLNAGLGRNRDFARKLTLVSAPAGFGKTTLLAAWLASLGEATPPIPSAWLQLDAEASDPVVFANHLLAAVQTRYPNVGGELLVRLREASRPPLPDLARSLLNELDQIEERFVCAMPTLEQSHRRHKKHAATAAIKPQKRRVLDISSS